MGTANQDNSRAVPALEGQRAIRHKIYEAGEWQERNCQKWQAPRIKTMFKKTEKEMTKMVEITFIKIDQGNKYFGFGVVSDDSRASVLVPQELVHTFKLSVGDRPMMKLTDKNNDGSALDNNRLLALDVSRNDKQEKAVEPDGLEVRITALEDEFGVLENELRAIANHLRELSE